MSPMLDLLTKFSIVFGICMTCYLIQLDNDNPSNKPSSGMAAKTLDTSWRYTTMGWQDSSDWAARTQFPKPVAARVHPFVWTALIVLVAIGLLIWAADEVDSLAKNPTPSAHPLRGHRCQCKPRCKNFCIQELMPKDYLALETK